MANFDANTWMVLGLIGAGVVTALLYALASLHRDQTTLHDLKLHVHELRRQYAQRLIEEAQVEVVEEHVVRRPLSAPPASAPSAGTAGVVGPPAERRAAA